MSPVYVRRFWVAGVVLAVVVALLPFSFHAERHLETATRVEGSQAEIVRQELQTRFHSDRKSTRLNSSHYSRSRMPSSA